MNFASAYDQGFLRVAACAIPTAIARPETNGGTIAAQAADAAAQGAGMVVFPELSLSGYAIDDLHLQAPLLDAVEAAITDLAAQSAELTPVLIVGAPLRHRHRVYNCAVVLHRGTILGVSPKSYLPTYREFYERRHFGAGDDIRDHITVAGHRVPFGPDLLFRALDVPGFTLHAEICEDAVVPIPPSAAAALAGATVCANLSGSPITVGKAESRKLLARSASVRCLSAYVFAAAGEGESTTDLSWDGQTFVYECGDLLGESERFPFGPRTTLVDVDLDRLDPPRGDIGLRRVVNRFPFVPDEAERLHQDCFEAYHIQVSGLAQRMRAIGTPKAVIGVSGGLDSTHALLVATRAMDVLGRPRWGSVSRPSTSARRPNGCSPTCIIRSRTGRRPMTSPSRTSRPGCATTTFSGSLTTTAASSSAPGISRSWRWGGAPTGSVTRCPTTPSTPGCPKR